MQSLHLDSACFHHYKGQPTVDEDEEFEHILITKGDSHDHQSELNQVILNLICENQSGIPVYMKPANVSDNMEGFKQIINAHISSLKVTQANRYLVADSALYVPEAIINLHNQGQLFITRVPQTLKEAKNLIKQAPTLSFSTITEGYEGVYCDNHYADVPQKWLLIRNQSASMREQQNLNKRMLKVSEQAHKSLQQLHQKQFARLEDAQKALAQWRAKQNVCNIEANIVEIAVYSHKGRPKPSESPERIEYQITGEFLTIAKKIDKWVKIHLI